MKNVVDVTERRQILEMILREGADSDVVDHAKQLAADPSVLVMTTATQPQLAIAMQVQVGRTAFVWPPAAVDENSSPTATTAFGVSDDGNLAHQEMLQSEMLQSALAILCKHDVQLAQALLDPSDMENRAHFVAAGFTHLADLAYIGAEESEFPATPPTSELKFAPLDAQQFKSQCAELERIVEATYEGTQDCREINGLRSIEDTLEGYRGVGQFDPANWFFVQADGENIGCLILANQMRLPIPALELVYMGIIPAARGRGYGAEVVRFAQSRAREQGAKRIVLAVDASNQPALAMYAECGFGLWGQRAVMIKKLEQAS